MSLPTTFFIGRGGGESPLWDWAVGSEYVFTNLGAFGNIGPTASTINSAYSGTPFAGTSYWGNATDGIQQITIPSTGTYKFSVAGAQGGNGNGVNGGGGAEVVTTGPLDQGQRVLLVVGQQGIGTNGGSAGGGGGSFVYLRGDSQAYDAYSRTDIIAAAGGGSGAQSGSNYDNGNNATTVETAGYGRTNIGTSGTSNYQRPAKGYAGVAEYSGGDGRNYQSSGGAGFLSRATMPAFDQTSAGGNLSNASSGDSVYWLQDGAGWGNTQSYSFQCSNGLNAGGSNHPGSSGLSGQYGARGFDGFFCSNDVWAGGGARGSGKKGGFGGGSGGADNCGGSGAGGGWSGGMGTGCYGVSGGGGSYGRDSGDSASFSGWTRSSVYANNNPGQQVSGADGYSYPSDGRIRIERIS